MIFMANSLALIISSVVISLVIGAGLAFVALPVVYPSIQSTPAEQTGVVQTVVKSWQDESYIFDNNVNWSLMNKTELDFTITNNSRIVASFSAPFLLSLYSTFTGLTEYQIALVIKGVTNTTTAIVYFDNAPSSSITRQLSFFPTLTVETGLLTAGTYNCTVQWRSLTNLNGNGSNLSVSHHNTNSVYHYDRWMKLEEVKD